LGANTFKFWVQLSSGDIEILLEKQNRWLAIFNIESCEISKEIPGENCWLAIWIEKTIVLNNLV
jgi:hypothetical protein